GIHKNETLPVESCVSATPEKQGASASGECHWQVTQSPPPARRARYLALPFYFLLFPHPPPPGDSMRSTSPISTCRLVLDGNVRFRPRRMSRFFPRAPGPPPARP